LSRPQIIKRRSLHTEIVDRLRDLIVDGSLKPGEKVNEVELCAAFGVSRTPLREAVKALAAEGLISLTPNRGATIATTTSREIVELFPIMGALEALAGELAAKAVTDAELAKLQRHHEMLVGAHARANWTAYIKANRAFHDRLIDIANNASLTLLYRQLLARTHAIRFVAKPLPEDWQEAVADHEQIMAALTARNDRKLGRLLALHVQHKAAAILKVAGRR
jgi:DNA-binding GntR family transcriptional regulator